ncbi:MAG: 16S rRNA (uracil(1498)-N(3))-methyltransferase [Bacteroidales bacterium]|nr:16S rRNA (uracil(1498)-N(3))-methyltransferase [Bacteroidales bacterium]MCB9013243.1 16S rRNA (uracil(1498)-N(3))-methyltransferase [Bacteroidales bacterium]
MNIFYSTDIRGNLGYLDASESFHCVKVLRLKEGEPVYLVDGIGGFYEGKIMNADTRNCSIEIVSSKSLHQKRDYSLHIGIAPTKNIERFEWFLEKATEIGIDSITPLLCKHSERKNIRTDRLEKLIISAMKQSLKAYLPELDDMCSFGEFINRKFQGEKLIAHCGEADREELILLKPVSRSFCILIGPEGDFSEEEIKLSTNAGFRAVSLGNSRLRTETAGLVACQEVADLMRLH